MPIRLIKRFGGAWNRFFLEEGPSVFLSFFRITTGLSAAVHVIPTLLKLDENYFSTAFRTKNIYFFPPAFIEWVRQSPDPLVVCLAVLFVISALFFTVGLFSQGSCLALTALCFYFYALNSLQIGTLEFEALLSVLCLLCVVPYHGDYFSLDAALGLNRNAGKPRPVFIQRLLQLQLGFVTFYAGLHKITGDGNWLTANPIQLLLSQEISTGIFRNFPMRSWLASNTSFCRALGLFVVMFELSFIFLLACRKTRKTAIVAGLIFYFISTVFMHIPIMLLFLLSGWVLLWLDSSPIGTPHAGSMRRGGR